MKNHKNGSNTAMTVETVKEWLASSNTDSPLHNLAVVNARLANSLARSLNLQKLTVEDISEHINKISNLIERINLYKTTKTEADAKELLGKDAADALEILNLLELEGVDKTRLDVLRKELNTDTNTRPSVSVNDIAGWTSRLQGQSESLSNKSSQEQLRLQTFTNRYTQSSDQSSTALQKLLQSIETIRPNLRGG